MHIREYFVNFVDVTKPYVSMTLMHLRERLQRGRKQRLSYMNAIDRCQRLKPTHCGTYLENLFKMRPLGVVSKKFIGDLNMANAIRSCNFREACIPRKGLALADVSKRPVR